DLPRLPTLDDRTLAQMLAELDGDDPGPVGDPSSVGGPAPVGDPAIGGDPASSAPTADPAGPTAAGSGPTAAGSGPTATRPVAATGRIPTPSERPLRLVEHPGGPVGYWAARGPVRSRSSA